MIRYSRGVRLLEKVPVATGAFFYSEIDKIIPVRPIIMKAVNAVEGDVFHRNF